MIYATPGASFEATLAGAPTGLTGTLGVRILDNAGGTTLPRQTSGIAEFPTGSGFYTATLTAAGSSGQYTVMWDTGVVGPATTFTDDLLVTTDPPAGIEASQVFEATLSGAPTGLAGTLGVRILDNVGGTPVTRTTTGVSESPAGSGFYTVTLTAPSNAGQYTVFWDTGSVSPSTTFTDALAVSAATAPVPTIQLRGLAWLALSDTGRIGEGAVTDDSGGGGTTAWTYGGTIPCRIDPLLANETVAAGRISDRSTHIITTPPGTAATITSRFAIVGRGTFEITAVQSRTGEALRFFEAVAVS